jgi:hypothetical protein
MRSREVLDSNSHRVALDQKNLNSGFCPHVVIVPIRATALVDPTTLCNATYLAKINEIVDVCQHFVPTDLGTGYQIPIVPVITCLDEVFWFTDHNAECLAPGYWAAYAPDDNAMARLEEKAMSAGIDVGAAVYTGWLTSEPAGGYGDLTDPRVAVVWELLARAARFGASTITPQARAAGWMQ